MNAYEKSQSLGLTGTDAEIVAILQTLTVSNIQVSKVADFLRKTGLWYRSGPTAMAGSIQRMINDRLIPQDFEEQLGVLWSAVFGDGAIELLTTDPRHAGLTYQIVSGLAAAAPESAALVDAFYALDGGRPWKDLTVEGFAAERQLSRKSEWVRYIVDQQLNPCGPEKADVLAALETAKAWIEAR